MFFNGADVWVLCSVCGAGPLNYLHTTQLGTWHLCESCEVNVLEHVSSCGDEPGQSRAIRYLQRRLARGGRSEPNPDLDRGSEAFEDTESAGRPGVTAVRTDPYESG